MTTTNDNAQPAGAPDEGTMRRLKKLLALAMDPAAAPGEAANAMRMAQSLMAKYNVSQGTIAATEIDEFTYKSTKATTPPPWESRLLAELCRAFGARCYWSGGPGFRGMRDKGTWHVVAHKPQMALIEYAFDVVRRQLIKARAAHVAAMPTHWTRPRKASEGDAFGLGFVYALAEKITTFADQDALIKAAIDKRLEDECGGKTLKTTTVNATLASQLAGMEAGKKASIHRPMNGREELVKIGR